MKRRYKPYDKGWIKLHRKLLRWEHHDNPVLFTVFVHLLLMAAQEDCIVNGYAVPRGAVATSIQQLSWDINVKKTTLFRALTKLRQSKCIKTQIVKPLKSVERFSEQDAEQETEQFLERNAERNITLITICNYDTYQCSKKTRGTESGTKKETNFGTDNGTESGTHTLYNKEEYKEEYKEIDVVDGARAGAREESDFLSSFLLRVSEVCDGSHELWLESMAAKLALSREDLLSLMNNDFKDHCIRNSKGPWADVRDFMSHFNYWATNRPPERTPSSGGGSAKKSSGGAPPSNGCGIVRRPKS